MCAEYCVMSQPSSSRDQEEPVTSQPRPARYHEKPETSETQPSTSWGGGTSPDSMEYDIEMGRIYN